MLVLTRHVEESIVIGGNIVVMVIAVKGDVVRLGVQAPREIPIHRKEIQDVIDKQKGGTDGKD